LGLLAHTRRVWVSDCNDPLERQRMQAAFLHFLPAELMGSHVGPQLSHTTGRSTSMALRTLNSLFGHFGVEADVSAMTADERQGLAQAIAAYKGARGWLHQARIHTIDCSDAAIVATWAVSEDLGLGWLALVAVDRPSQPLPPLLRVPGLCPSSRYRVCTHALWPAPERGSKRAGAFDQNTAYVLDGASLGTVGLRLPLLWPGDGCLIEFQRQP
jgi:alpha-galactosidase